MVLLIERCVFDVGFDNSRGGKSQQSLTFIPQTQSNYVFRARKQLSSDGHVVYLVQTTERHSSNIGPY